MPVEGERNDQGMVWMQNGPLGPGWYAADDAEPAEPAQLRSPGGFPVFMNDSAELSLTPRPGFHPLSEGGSPLDRGQMAKLTAMEAHAKAEQDRQTTIDLKKSLPDIIRQGAARKEGLLREGAELREGELRRQAAQALAGGLAQAGSPTSGAAFAQGRQTALDVAAGIGDIRAGLSERLARMPDARLAAATAEIEAMTFAREAGTETTDAQKLIAGYAVEIAGIIEKHKWSGFLGLDDDEDAMAAEILAMADEETNPIAKQYLLDEADGVRDFGPHARDV